MRDELRETKCSLLCGFKGRCHLRLSLSAKTAADANSGCGNADDGGGQSDGGGESQSPSCMKGIKLFFFYLEANNKREYWLNKQTCPGIQSVPHTLILIEDTKNATLKQQKWTFSVERKVGIQPHGVAPWAGGQHAQRQVQVRGIRSV